MNKEEYNEIIEELYISRGELFLEVLDHVKDQIADARNGDYSTESRRCAIDMIDSELYNKIKNFNKKESKPKEGDSYI